MSTEPSRPGLPGPGRMSRKPVGLSRESRYTMGPLIEGRALPVLVQPALAGLDLPVWIGENRGLITEHLKQAGGVLFRGFDVASPEAFEACVKALSGRLLEYTYRSTPRRKVSGNIYTSTEYPADRSIPLHNEMSYSRAWPMKLWFFAMVAAPQGGETPIADSRGVLARIPAGIRDTFERRGVMYVRNYGPGIDLPWQEVFQTADRSDVERLCRETGIEWEWKGDDELTTRQVCQAVAVHPETGAAVWFNQAHLFHVSSHDAAVRDQLIAQFSEQGLPRHAYYGDGGAIEAEVLDEIRRAFDAETVRFAWQPSDLMLLDNMLVAHGRAPFGGPRRVLVGMAEQGGAGSTCVEM